MSSIPKEDLDLIVREIVDALTNQYTDDGQPFWLLRGLAAYHPAVRHAVIAIDAAQRTAVALVARDLEGLIGREIEKRRGEAAVSMLAATLALVAPEPEGPRWQHKSDTDKYIGRLDHEDLYWQPDIDRVGCVWSDGLTHGGYMRDVVNTVASPRMKKIRAMLDAHLARSSR